MATACYSRGASATMVENAEEFNHVKTLVPFPNRHTNAQEAA